MVKAPPLMREGPGSTHEAGRLTQVFHPFEVDKMRSSYYTVGDCCRRLHSNRVKIFLTERKHADDR